MWSLELETLWLIGAQILGQFHTDLWSTQYLCKVGIPYCSNCFVWWKCKASMHSLHFCWGWIPVAYAATLYNVVKVVLNLFLSFSFNYELFALTHKHFYYAASDLCKILYFISFSDGIVWVCWCLNLWKQVASVINEFVYKFYFSLWSCQATLASWKSFVFKFHLLSFLYDFYKDFQLWIQFCNKDVHILELPCIVFFLFKDESKKIKSP